MTTEVLSRAAEAALARAAFHGASIADRPSQRRSEVDSHPAVRSIAVQAPTEARSATTNPDGTVTVCGFASVTESPYEMYDMFGPYNEVVSLGAFDKSLAAMPLVELALNHGKSGGASMASTRNGTLKLEARKQGDMTGLWYEANVDPTRSDVADMIKALERGDLAEASFKFRIESGMWSPDYTEFRINEADLNRGDVSPVNFGANPAATSEVRNIADGLALEAMVEEYGIDAVRAALAALEPPAPSVPAVQIRADETHHIVL